MMVHRETFEGAFTFQVKQLQLAQSYCDLLTLYGIQAMLYYEPRLPAGRIRFEIMVGDVLEKRSCHVANIGYPEVIGMVKRAFAAKGVDLA